MTATDANVAETALKWRTFTRNPIPPEVWAGLLLADRRGALASAVARLGVEDVQAMIGYLEGQFPDDLAVIKHRLGLSPLPPKAGVFWRSRVLPFLKRRLDTPRPRPTGQVDLFATVKAGVPVAELAGRFTELRRSGNGRLRGLCPLHDERTPSFFVYEPDRWVCFGACHDGGDVIELARKLIDQGKL